GDEEDWRDPFVAHSATRYMSIARRVYEVVSVVGSEGITTPEIAGCMKTTTKRLTKVLATLEKAKVVVKKAQRQGKCFMYRYYLSCYDPKEVFDPSIKSILVQNRNIKQD